MFLGLDLGTSNVKALAVDATGQIVAQGSAPVERFETPDGGIEQDIEQIWDATRRAIRQTVAEMDAKSIEAIGISSQGGALQLLDANDRPLGRVISWMDRRGKPYDQGIEETWGTSYLVDHIGSNLSTTTLGQIMRLRQDAPEVLGAAKAIGYVGDLIVGRFCGRRAHDATSLSLAMLYNPRLRGVDHELLARLGIDDKRQPDLLAANEPAGRLTDQAASQTGLKAGIPISPAVHDQYAAALGTGAVAEGDVLIGTGTAWVILAVTNRLTPPVAERTFVCTHPVDGLFGQLFSMGGVGAVIQWAVGLIGEDMPDAATLDQWIASVPAGADGLRFELPATAGRAAAIVSPSGGTFVGRNDGHGPKHLLRAVFECLALELAKRLDWFARADLPMKRVLLSGPAASGGAIGQIVANALNRPVTCLREPATGAMGATTIAHSLVDRRTNLAVLASQWAIDGDVVMPEVSTRE
ncbi:MAG: FGGY-family carbohydrate kinase [Pirellulaceae bacterium]|nr:FGGY-family carbohydrate kinase [Pirellulaceae bacterium]